MGRVSSIITACNFIDTIKGGRGDLTIEDILKRVDFWKYALEVDVLINPAKTLFR